RYGERWGPTSIAAGMVELSWSGGCKQRVVMMQFKALGNDNGRIDKCGLNFWSLAISNVIATIGWRRLDGEPCGNLTLRSQDVTKQFGDSSADPLTLIGHISPDRG
ncbi:hypothetical protein Tco_0876869, partial [Tanacetum coccineum]